MQRLFQSLLLFVLLAAVFVIALSFLAQIRLGQYQRELSTLRNQARSMAGAAEALEASGNYDLHITLSDRLLARLLLELRGAEHVNRLGDRVLIRDAEVSFDQGFVRLEAEGEFHWRFGYQGPVRVVYQGFAQLQEDGSCRLDLRLAEGHPLGRLNVLRPLVEPWLVLQIQNSFRWPTLTLPLTIQENFSLGEIDRRLMRDQIQLFAPKRELQVAMVNPVVMIDRGGLKVIVEQVRIGDQAPKPRENLPSPPAQENTDVRVVMRHHLLNEALQQFIAPVEDLFLDAEIMEDVWRQNKRVMGIRVRNRASLYDVTGVLDIQEAELQLSQHLRHLRLRVGGSVAGRVKGRAYGINVQLPFQAEPYLDNTLPIELAHNDRGIRILWPEKELTMDLPVRTKIAGRNVHFDVPVRARSNRILRPVYLPRLVHDEVSIPEKMVRNRVERDRRMALEVAWHLDLPQTEHGYLIFEGQMTSFSQVKARSHTP